MSETVSLWERGQRFELLRTWGELLWRVFKFLFPAIAGSVGVTYLAALEHLRLWQLALIFIVAGGVGVWILAGIRLLSPSLAWRTFPWLNDSGLRVGSKTWLINTPTFERKTFTNQEIEIDGKAFAGCTFTNVTLMYRGRAPFSITNPTINGTMQVKSDFLPIKAFLDLLEWQKTLPGWSGTLMVHEDPRSGQRYEISKYLPGPPPTQGNRQKKKR